MKVWKPSKFVRDWIAAGTDGVALLSLDQEEPLRALRPLTGNAPRQYWKA